jgi:hypothetical protein
MVFEMVLDHRQEPVQLRPCLRFFRLTEQSRPILHRHGFLLVRKVHVLSHEVAEPERANRIR